MKNLDFFKVVFHRFSLVPWRGKCSKHDRKCSKLARKCSQIRKNKISKNSKIFSENLHENVGFFKVVFHRFSLAPWRGKCSKHDRKCSKLARKRLQIRKDRISKNSKNIFREIFTKFFDFSKVVFHRFSLVPWRGKCSKHDRKSSKLARKCSQIRKNKISKNSKIFSENFHENVRFFQSCFHRFSLVPWRGKSSKHDRKCSQIRKNKISKNSKIFFGKFSRKFWIF